MTTPAALAAIDLVNGLLIPNLKDSLPVVIIFLICQGIHPEIIFELIPHVQISQRQYHAIIMAMTQLRLFASLLPEVKGYKPLTFEEKMSRFMEYPQNKVSRVFADFQNSVLKKMLVQCGFAGTLPFLEFLKKFASNLVLVRTSPLPIFPIGRLFLSPNADLVLLKTALQMQSMIAGVRSSYPEIVSFLAQNKNRLMNLFMVWRNQVVVKQTMYGSLLDIPEPARIHTLFIIGILAVTDHEFIDESLVKFIQNCGDCNSRILYSSKYLDFLQQTCEKFDLMNLQVDDIGRMIKEFSSMRTSTTHFNVSYAIERWSMAFGKIVHGSSPEFEEKTFKLKSSTPIFEVFGILWKVFFQNFSRTFAVSFLPFGNIPWSEGYTRLCTTNFNRIIRDALVYFAFRIGAKNDHAYIKYKLNWNVYFPITTESYGRLIFPTYIRTCKASLERLSCFLRDFWKAHQKPDPNMSDIDYIRWFFSIQGYDVSGRSWIELMNALQNGTELPIVQDGGLSGDFGYLSCPTDPTDLEVQIEYNKNFRKEDGSELQISDYFGGGLQFPPLPPHAYYAL